MVLQRLQVVSAVCVMFQGSEDFVEGTESEPIKETDLLITKYILESL